MGLLNFKKKSRKQQPSKPFEIAHHVPNSTFDSVSRPLSTPNAFRIGSSYPKEAETSLMDDIMSELDSAKSINNYANASPITRQSKASRPSPLLIFDLSPSQQQQQQQQQQQKPSSPPSNGAAATKNPAYTTSQQQPSASAISIPTFDSNRASRPNMHKQQQQHQQQQKPKPLLSFSNSNFNIKNVADMDSDSDQDDFQPIIMNKAPSPSPSPPLPLPPPQAQTQTSATPPAYNIATNNNINSSRNLMDRMKERHRLEARRSLQPSPFLDNTQARINNLSSPSMPIIFSAATAASPTTASPPVDTLSSPPPPRPLVQSHSFTTYVKPATPPQISKPRQLQPGHLVRSVSDMNDIYNNASKPIQTQSDISLHKRAPPPLKQLHISHSPSATNIRNSYLQTGPVMTSAYEEEKDMFRAQINSNPMRFQLNRSVSAYPSFPQQSFQQQQQMELQQQQQILQQQQQQQIQQQQIQQQIELQQHQLQEQQRMQQQKLQQLQLQQQQQQILNQTLLETTAAVTNTLVIPSPLKINHRRDTPKAVIVRSESNINTKHVSKHKSNSKPARPLYERSSSPPSSADLLADCHHNNHKCRQHEMQQHHCHCRSSTTHNTSSKTVSHRSSNVPDTPPPESHHGSHDNIFQKEITEQPASSSAKTIKNQSENFTAIEETLIANSSTSTLTEGENTDVTTSEPTVVKAMSTLIRLPNKLKQELQSMQLRRSTYSVPDLTTFSSSDDDNDDNDDLQYKDWSTIERFSNSSGTINVAHEDEPIKMASTCAERNNLNSSSSTPEPPLVYDCSVKQSQSSFHLVDNCSSHQHPHNHHHHHKKHKCSKRHSTCCTSSSSKKHHCSSSKHTSIKKSFSNYSMDMSPSILTTCNHHQEKRHHHHHHGNQHRSSNRHGHHHGYQCHNNGSRYTLVLQDQDDEEEN